MKRVKKLGTRKVNAEHKDVTKTYWWAMVGFYLILSTPVTSERI